MLNFNKYENIKFIVFLGIILIILFIIRNLLLKKINQKELEIAQEICIGYEEIQEDYADTISKPYGTLAVLADGLGKNEAGKISSIVSVKTAVKMFEEEGNTHNMPYFFNKVFSKVNKEIIKRVEKDQGGASVLISVVKDNLLYYGLIGDVMLAVFRDKELIRLTEGHAISEMAKKAYQDGRLQKSEALYALKEKKLLYYVGQEAFNNIDNIEICEVPIELYKNDVIVLMSKGVYEGIRWIELEDVLNQKNVNVEEACTEIIQIIKNNDLRNCNGSIVLMKYCGK